MSYEKDKLDSYVTSASLSTALAPYVTSDSLSAAIAGLDLAPYVTSNSLSAAVATDVLTVRGAASVSATMSAAAVTIAGRPANSVLLGYQALSGNAPIAGFSGSWSDFCLLQLRVIYRGVAMPGAVRPSVNIYSDGGTSPVLSIQAATVSASQAIIYNVDVYGVDGTGTKGIACLNMNPALFTSNSTATANTAFINCLRFQTSATVTAGFAVLTAWRKT